MSFKLLRYHTMTLILFLNLLFPSLVLVVSRDTCPESTFGSATQTITKVKSDNPENIKQDILMGSFF